jgi:hypothetical protein
MDTITFVIDPVAASLLGIFLIGLVVLISFDFLRIRIHSGKPRRYYPKVCHHCGGPWDGNHTCEGRRK